MNDGYYGYYETTGFERNTMGYISGARKSEVELQFSAAKSASKGGTVEEFNEAVDVLRTMIRTDANKLDGVDEEGNATGGGRSAGLAPSSPASASSSARAWRRSWSSVQSSRI